MKAEELLNKYIISLSLLHEMIYQLKITLNGNHLQKQSNKLNQQN